MRDDKVVATWSGGVDSTAVIVNLAKQGWDIYAYTLNFYADEFVKREREARNKLSSIIKKIAKDNGARFSTYEVDAEWIWNFSYKDEIPRRNKHIIDYLIMKEMKPDGITNIAMGEYIGADTWAVKDHVGAADADHRHLSAYILNEYGLDYRLISLQDFGESRYKSDRFMIGWEIIGKDMLLTTNCLINSEVSCGKCYKCIERRAAIRVIGAKDTTVYEVDPEKSNPEEVNLYMKQMKGERVNIPYLTIK